MDNLGELDANFLTPWMSTLYFFFFFLELVTCDSTEQGRKHTCDSITREMVTILQGTLLLSCDTGGVHEMHL